LRAWWAARRSRLLRVWAVGLVVAALVSGASAIGYLERWHAWALDKLQELQGRPAPHDVVIIAVDDLSFAGLEWPISYVGTGGSFFTIPSDPGPDRRR